MPYFSFVKMTMHIDEGVLSEVMRITGVSSKTGAVEVALSEMVRRNRFKELAKKGLGLSPDELKNVWKDPFPAETARAAETPSRYAGKRARR